MQKKIVYPILFKNQLSNPLFLEGGIVIRRIRKSERRRFFGLKSIDYYITDQGLNFAIHKLTAYSNTEVPKGIHDHRDWLISHTLTDDDWIFASNHVVEVPAESSDKLIQDLILALNIVQPTVSRCWLGFSPDENGYHFHHYRCYGNFSFINLDNKMFTELEKVWSGLQNISRDRIDVALNFYLRGLHDNTSQESRYLMVAIAMELLLLRDTGSELSFRFSLRLSKILHKYMKPKLDITELFNRSKMIYELRSQISHDGMSSKLNNESFFMAVQYCQVLIKLYLIEKRVFDKDYLHQISIH